MTVQGSAHARTRELVFLCLMRPCTIVCLQSGPSRPLHHCTPCPSCPGRHSSPLSAATVPHPPVGRCRTNGQRAAEPPPPRAIAKGGRGRHGRGAQLRIHERTLTGPHRDEPPVTSVFMADAVSVPAVLRAPTAWASVSAAAKPATTHAVTTDITAAKKPACVTLSPRTDGGPPVGATAAAPAASLRRTSGAGTASVSPLHPRCRCRQRRSRPAPCRDIPPWSVGGPRLLLLSGTRCRSERPRRPRRGSSHTFSKTFSAAAAWPPSCMSVATAMCSSASEGIAGGRRVQCLRSRQVAARSPQRR